MSSNLDPAILRALSLSSSADIKVSSHGSSGFSRTIRITTDDKKQFFAKIGHGSDAATMFEGEFASLNAIHDVVPSLCPAALSHGALANQEDGHFLITQWLDLGVSNTASGQGSGVSLATKLAKLHTTPAPVPKGHKSPMFGFPVTTCCGDTPQDNSFKPSWAEFYAEHRLRGILTRSEKQNGKDPELRATIEKVASQVVPRLLADGHLGGESGVIPVVVHGDLWSGNKGRGRIGGNEVVEDVVFDPSASYSHSEFELGIMKMFGGFGGSFLKEYHELCPKTEPVEEYEDRIKLYELYHHLNHHSIFGGGYRSGAMAIMKTLIGKYGD